MQLYKDEIDKELILNAEIQRQNLKALPKAFKDRKIKSPVTQKMIDEFKQQFNKKKGDKAFLFPEYNPNLIDIQDELSKLQRPLTEYEVYDTIDEIDEKIKIHKLLNDVMIPQYRRVINENKDKINEINDKLTSVSKNKDKKNLIYKQDKFKKEIIQLEENILRDNNDISDLQSEINQLQRKLEENNELVDNYKNLEFTVSEKNKKILADYTNNIRILNEGKFNTSQEEGETEQEYLQRLSELANEEYDDTELLERAYLSNINEFKENMKKVLSSEWKIETILNSLDREDVFLLNKTFEMFKRQALKLYGFNNTNITPELYLELIKYHLNSLQPVQSTDAYYKKEDEKKQYEQDQLYNDMFDTPFVEASSFEEPEEVEASSFEEPKFSIDSDKNDPIKFKLLDDGLILQIKNIDNNRIVRLSFEDRGNSSYSKVFYQMGDGDIKQFTGSDGLKFIDKFYIVFRDYLEMTDEQIDKEFKSRNTNFSEQSFSRKLKSDKGLIDNQKLMTGRGLKEKLPAFFEFGKVILLLDKLYYKNTLSIKDKKKKNIQGIPNSKVSNEFVNIIMKMIKEEAPALKDDIYELSEKEQELFTILMYKSGFYKETPTNNKNIIKKLKERLQLVEGTIKAGNNNTDNFKELYEIIFKMTNLGVISLSAGRNYYKEIKKEYS
jgi:hypothetical protein